MNVLLDTCAIRWAVAEPDRLTDSARTALLKESTRVCVSPISSAELACGVERGRIKLDRHWRLWFRHFLAENGWEILPIDLRIMEEAYSLPGEFHPDPVDRIIVASARVHSLHVATGDSRIRKYPVGECCR
jgi:PIN domain nuclease of toxin-antitoxin system